MCSFQRSMFLCTCEDSRFQFLLCARIKKTWQNSWLQSHTIPRLLKRIYRPSEDSVAATLTTTDQPRPVPSWPKSHGRNADNRVARDQTKSATHRRQARPEALPGANQTRQPPRASPTHPQRQHLQEGKVGSVEGKPCTAKNP